MSVELGFDQERLRSVIEKVRGRPEVGRTVPRASTRWRQGLCSEATIPRREGGHTVTMDEPASIGGSDTGPNMVEMVLGAYGCCLTTGFVLNAALRGVRLEGVDIELEGDLDLRTFFGITDADDVSPGCTEVRAVVDLRAPDATPEQVRELYEQAVRSSPVGAIIARPVTLRTELRSATALPR